MKYKWIFLFLFLTLLPLLSLRDYTVGNELRYLSIADEAMREGTFFAFTNHGVSYADKPPLYFWIIMLGKWLFGEHYMWFISLFSFIPAGIITCIMDRWCAKELADSYRTTGVLMMMSCGLFLALILILRMDMLMCMFITLALYIFYRMLKSEGNKQVNAVLFPLFIFLALFTKGPIGFLVPLLSTFVFLLLTKRFRTIGKYWGWKTWTILLLCCAGWFGAAYAEGGQEYMHNMLFHQTIDRAVNSFRHDGPFYHYCLTIWYAMLPWSFLLASVLIISALKKPKYTELQKFFLTIIGTTFVLLSSISSKVDVYMLPMFPFIVYLALMFLPEVSRNRWVMLSLALPASIFVLAFPAYMVVSRMETMAFAIQPLFYVAAGLLSLTGILALYILYKKEQTLLAIRTLVYGLFVAAFIGSWDIPKINGEIGYRELCTKAKELARIHQTSDYYVWKLRRPENMDVYLQQDIIITTPEAVAQSGDRQALFLVPAKELSHLPDYFAEKETYQIGRRYAIIVLKD